MAIPIAKQYIADFENMGFGMFVHWGLYSQVGKGEWLYYHTDITMDEYKKLFDTFTAEDFNAEELVLMAKSAGCKYITLTTRHHEGFSLFDTCGLSDYDAPHSPAKRDLVREFVDACNKHAIVPFFYHTTLDWYQESFENDFDAYLEYLRKSVEILCKNYGKIGGLWFDGNWSKPDADWKEEELYATIRKYQPEAMIINNTGLFERGRIGNPEIDSVTFEQGHPTPMDREGMSKYLASEMCYTINDHWAICNMDFNYKSPAELIRSLCNCRKVGANLLLNIGPTGQGGINLYHKEIFKIIGEWVKIYGKAIYNAKPCEAYGIGCNFMLKDDEYLYMFFFNLGNNGSKHVAVDNGEYVGAYCFGNVSVEVEYVEWMDNGQKLPFIQGEGMLAVDAIGYDYGWTTCVRVAKAKIKK